MPRFAIHNPYFVLVVCVIILVLGITSLVRMPVELFPSINLPVVVVATFYNGMPPEEIESEITSRFERFFTLGAGIDHIESRSLPGVSIIKIYFQPGTNADADVTMISNLAMAQLRRLPPGTLPPVVIKFDASSLPVCLITLKGEGMSEAQLRDVGQFSVRNQLAVVKGASVPPPFGGKYRQIMVYVDPVKLQAYQLSVMDVVRAINEANLILPAGDAKIGPYDYAIYSNSQIPNVDDINLVPLKNDGQRLVTVRDVGWAADANQIQTNLVRVDGQRSVFLPILKQGGDTNTIAVVDGIKSAVPRLLDVPKELVTRVVFDQSLFVKRAIETLLHEGGMGLFLTALMVLVFLGSLRATVAVSLSIPLSALAAFVALYFGGSSVNTMILAGLALAFSRLIDNSVIVLENIFRHLEMGEAPHIAAERGGQEVSQAVLAATLSTAVVFFPVTFLYGVSRFLFSALALAVVLSLFASYAVAMTVVPLFCSRFIKSPHELEGIETSELESPVSEQYARTATPRGMARFNNWFNLAFVRMLFWYERGVRRALLRPVAVIVAITGFFLASLLLYPRIGVAFFPRTEGGQFVLSVKAPSGSRLEVTNDEVKKIEAVVRAIVPPDELAITVANIGIIPDFSAIYTSNSGPDTATVQVALKEGHRVSSFEYMARIQRRIRQDMPELTVFGQSGSMVDAILNQGRPAPIDVQVSGSNLEHVHQLATVLANQIRQLPGVSESFIPQDMEYPAMRLVIDRQRARQMGLSQREVINNVITGLTSNGMIAPTYWIDPKTGNDYMLTVQFPEKAIGDVLDLQSIPLRAPGATAPVNLSEISTLDRISSPAEIDHYQIQRVVDVYVTPSGEDLGKVSEGINRILATTPVPSGVRVNLRGMVEGMQASFRSFGLGLLLATLLLYLILVAQFRSLVDPLLILLAVPTGLTGVLLMLFFTGTTLNVQSLMGVVMMVGIVVSNSILIVEFTHRLEATGMGSHEAAIAACRVRLRPILMTSLATVIGLFPLALKLGVGSEAYAPLARAIIGGLLVSVVLTVFIVPAAYTLVYRGKGRSTGAAGLVEEP